MNISINNVKEYFNSYIKSHIDEEIRVIEIKEVIENTNVNYIFEVKYEKEKVIERIYLKHARPYLKVNKNIKFSIDRQNFEYRSLIKFKEILVDNVVPDVLYFDRKNHVLALTDIGKNMQLIPYLLKKGIIYLDAIAYFGMIIGKIHASTYNNNVNIRNSDENAKFIDFIMRFRSASARQFVSEEVDNLLIEGNHSKTSLVYGDPFIKNIFMNEKKVRFCDLEAVMRYDPGFDIGYALSDLIITGLLNLKDPSVVRQIIKNFLNGYQKSIKKRNDIELKKILLKSSKFLGMILLHRLVGENNPNIIHIENQDSKKKFISNSILLLKNSYDTPLDCFDEVFNDWKIEPRDCNYYEKDEFRYF